MYACLLRHAVSFNVTLKGFFWGGGGLFLLCMFVVGFLLLLLFWSALPSCMFAFYVTLTFLFRSL